MSTLPSEHPAPLVSIATLEDCIDYIISLCNAKHYTHANVFMHCVFTTIDPSIYLVIYDQGKPIGKMLSHHYIIQELHRHGVYECLLNT